MKWIALVFVAVVVAVAVSGRDLHLSRPGAKLDWSVLFFLRFHFVLLEYCRHHTGADAFKARELDSMA